MTLMVQRSEGVSILGEGLESEEPMGIIWWRNPSERAQDAVFSVASVLELPQLALEQQCNDFDCCCGGRQPGDGWRVQ